MRAGEREGDEKVGSAAKSIKVNKRRGEQEIEGKRCIYLSISVCGTHQSVSLSLPLCNGVALCVCMCACCTLTGIMLSQATP